MCLGAKYQRSLQKQNCCAGDSRVALVDSRGATIAVNGPSDSAGAAAVAVERQDSDGKTIQYVPCSCPTRCSENLSVSENLYTCMGANHLGMSSFT